MKIGFIGLGNVGGKLAGSLLRNKFDITVRDLKKNLTDDFKKKGAKVKTILTKRAKEFVTPLSVTSLSQEKVYDDLFNVENEAEMDHISLSRWSDVILVAPATANTISKLSSGASDDLASTVMLASNKDIFLAPAMNVIAIPTRM